MLLTWPGIYSSVFGSRFDFYYFVKQVWT